MERLKRWRDGAGIAAGIAFLQWFLTTILQVDRHIFSYSSITKVMLLVKLAYLIALMVFWVFLFKVITRLKEKDEIYRRGVRIFAAYFVFAMCLLAILWPGTWTWDDIGILRGILGYASFVSWQHFLSGLYQAVLLQIIPHPGGIILIQNFIIAVCVAFCVVKLERCFHIKASRRPVLDMIVKLLPFMLPPVLLYQYSGYRMGIYVYLELVLLVILICAQKEQGKWTWNYCVLLCALAAVVSCWRTESFLYILFVPAALLFVKDVTCSRGKKVVSIVLMFLLFFSIRNVQNYFMGDSNQYELISLMGPYSAVVRSADFDEDKEEIDQMDKVVDVQMILDYPSERGERLYWKKHAYRTDYSEEEFRDALKAFLKLAVKYPVPVFMERWNLFLSATGINGATYRINYQNIDLFNEDDTTENDEWFQEKGYLPFFKKGREILIQVLSCNDRNGKPVRFFRFLIWNAWIPILILLAGWLRAVWKRKWYSALLLTAVCIRIPIVFLTEPAGWIMYLLSFYFLGYILGLYKILEMKSE